VVDGVESDVAPMPMAALTLHRGDRFRHRSAGGGGFGSPLVRDPASVLEDVLAGKVSVDNARELYGVVVVEEPGRVDEAATAALRGAA
jgi:N-methylhydantoinase B